MLSYDAGTVSPERSVELGRQAFDMGDEMLMIYSRDRPTISLGRFSSKDSYDHDYVKEHNIAVVRRMSGGSVIFCDPGQITVTYVAPRGNFPTKEDSYRFFGERLTEALGSLGIGAEYKPVNDVILNGGKISGSAQYRNDKTVMVHGSLILRMGEHFPCIVPKKEVRYPVTSIEKECGSVPKRRDIFDSLVDSFQD